MNDSTGKVSITDAQEIEMAQYIADMLLELRNMAKSANLPTLLGLLELSFCEAFSIANKVEEFPAGEIEKLKRFLELRARHNITNYKFLGNGQKDLFARP